MKITKKRTESVVAVESSQKLVPMEIDDDELGFVERIPQVLNLEEMKGLQQSHQY